MEVGGTGSPGACEPLDVGASDQPRVLCHSGIRP